ncbi:MAG: amino acid adenylation domain-containing protein [Cyanobacteria bacterium P01_F01_bin.116]
MNSLGRSTLNFSLIENKGFIGKLSYGQQQIWFLEQLASGNAGYNVPSVYHIYGKLQIEALKLSLTTLMEHHQAFRTVFKAVDGQPMQIVADTVDLRLTVVDLTHLSGKAREIEARKIANDDANRPFDLASLPLWRLKLIKLDEDNHWLLFTIHHIVFDGWSSDIFVNELTALYESACQGLSYTLPETVQPTDFAQWQQQYLTGNVLERLLTYWKHKLGSHSQPLELFTDFPRPTQSSYRGDIASIHLPDSLAERLNILGRQNQTTLFMTLLAAFKVLLFRYTAQTDIAVGTPIANRSRPEHANVLGFLVNTLVLRTDLDGKKSFESLLDQVRMTALEAYDHQDLPFELLVEHLNPERDLSYHPLFQVMFQVSNRSSSDTPEQAQTFKLLDVETRTANFDLTLEVEETDSGLIAEIEYSCDLFKPETIGRMLKHYKTLLEGIVANPQQPIDKLPVLTMEERQQLLNGWNRAQSSIGPEKTIRSYSRTVDLSLSLKATDDGLIGNLTHWGDRTNAAAIAAILQQYLPQLQRIASEEDYRPPEQLTLEHSNISHLNVTWNTPAKAQNGPIKCLHEYFVEQVKRSPNQIALSYKDQQLTYAELNARANQVAHHLINQGVKPDMPVGICCERSLEMIIALLAVLKAGGAYLPLDPNYPQERLEYIMKDAQVAIVITQSPLRSKLLNIQTHILCLDIALPLLDNNHHSEPQVDIAPHHLAYIIYTSGSTGRPKGVMIEHQAAAHYVQATIAQYDITPADCVLQFASISFDVAIEEIFTSLLTGARLQLRTADMISTSSQFLRCCQEWDVTVLNLPTAYWHQLVTDIANNQFQLPLSVRLMVIGGERALPSLVKVWQQQVGDYPPLINAYGPTETTVTATGCWISSDTEILQEVPIGKPFANTEIYILDKYRQPVPVGVPGELYIGGNSLARGYLNRPDLTELKFIPHPYSRDANARLYKTGDQVRYLSDGNIEFLGRVDNQVKIRGFRIELGEVESALLLYPGVRETIVVVREDTPGNPQLIGYVVPSSEQQVSSLDLKGFLQQRLPSYMVPAKVVPLETLPLTPNNKIDVRALPAPSSIMTEEEMVYVAPRTPLEDTLAKIWAEILGLPKVSIQTSFFELGGHSLQAIQAIAQITNSLEVELPISALFQAPTVEQMAKLLGETSAKVSWSPLVPLQARGTKQPFFAIHGGHGEVLFYQLLAEYLGQDQPFYALRARGNDYPDMPHQDIKEMAACYVEAMRKIQPEGPYRLGGTSLGGIVAFEMAQQLRTLGQTTELLVLFDTGGFDDFTWPLPLHQRMINAFRYIPKYGLADTRKRLSLRILKLFTIDSAVEFYRATGTLPRRSSHAMRVWETVWEANLDALEEYIPQTYDGSLTLLRAIGDGSFMWNKHEPDYGWGRYALGGVNYHDVPGTHIGIFQEPHVEQLACIMKQLLDKTS